ncbi:DEAD/DEAH box helicase [Alloyangia pacifica]|uniref:ATP-dependent RNA helicase DeaD n=1 Tax=Alloyangia pacifica TaxID=311180 RepID=A0A1I6RPP9_9RHOB|nr:DEAD/DEAH box helicase [Alloyangia pacifica]SDG55399.1 ATP-dependent RNA helicase DeaD [Alloyangia pacifica]SFS66697.1 ATP-dependent RNA helicase DeaD [Alloyangia pacifica]
MKQTLAAALQARGYETLTPVQEAVTDPAIAGADLLVSAQTGSGKTVGFGLAIAPAILGDAESFGAAGAPEALIIAPTRELALQVRRELSWLYAEAGAVMASCVGGMDARTERRALERGAHIVVATPGRLCDHLRRGALDLSQVKAVVLDEADEMLDLGFREDLETILEASNPERQTLLFSATVSPQIAQLAQRYQRDSQRIQVQGGAKQHSDIEYRAVIVAQGDQENAITNLLRFHEAPNAIVFANTRATVSRLVSRLTNRGFAVVGLSGELSQDERSHALQAMRDGRARVCVATDVAARGIDLPNLDLVVHAELPQSNEALLHRSGRTGRAGRKGISALIVPLRDRKKAERIMRFAKVEAEWGEAPTADAVLERDEARMLADPMWTDPSPESDAALVTQITEKYSAEEIAQAMVRQWRSLRSAPEELLPVDARAEKAPRSEPFGPSRWFTVTVGREGNANPRWLLPKICRAGNITRESLGAIRIADELTYVEIADNAVAGFLEALGPDMEVAQGLVMEEVDGLPEELKSAPRGPKKPGGFKKDGGFRKEGGFKKEGGFRKEGGFKKKEGFGGPGKGGFKRKSEDGDFDRPRRDGDKPKGKFGAKKTFRDTDGAHKKAGPKKPHRKG